MVATNNPDAANEQPERDRPFSEIAPLFRAWQEGAPDTIAPPASSPPATPEIPRGVYDYARGLAEGVEMQIADVARLTEENRLLRAHLRAIGFQAHWTRHELMQPNRPRRGMITDCQEIVDRAYTLVNRPRAAWPWVDTRGIDGPTPLAQEAGEYAPPWQEAGDRYRAAFDAFLALTTPAGPRTPGYQERKRQMDAIRRAAIAMSNANGEYGRVRGKHGE